jgi:hypothetical protein
MVIFRIYRAILRAENLGGLIGNDAIVTKRFVIRAGFVQTLPVG